MAEQGAGQYPQTQEEHNLEERQLLLLLQLAQSPEWELLKERYLEPLLKQAERQLQDSNEMEVILRAQGARRALLSIQENFEALIRDAREEQQNG